MTYVPTFLTDVETEIHSSLLKTVAFTGERSEWVRYRLGGTYLGRFGTQNPAVSPHVCDFREVTFIFLGFGPHTAVTTKSLLHTLII